MKLLGYYRVLLDDNNNPVASCTDTGLHYYYHNITLTIHRNLIMDVSEYYLEFDWEFLKFYDTFMELDKAILSHNLQMATNIVEVLEPYRNLLDDRINYALSQEYTDPHTILSNNRTVIGRNSSVRHVDGGRIATICEFEFPIIDCDLSDECLCEWLHYKFCKYIFSKRLVPTFNVNLHEFLSHMI